MPLGTIEQHQGSVKEQPESNGAQIVHYTSCLRDVLVGARNADAEPPPSMTASHESEREVNVEGCGRAGVARGVAAARVTSMDVDAKPGEATEANDQNGELEEWAVPCGDTEGKVRACAARGTAAPPGAAEDSNTVQTLHPRVTRIRPASK